MVYGKNKISKCFDRIDWYFEKALECYCNKYKVSAKNITEDERREVMERAVVPMGFYMAWIVKHNLEGDIHKENLDEVEKFRNEQITGSEFILEYCDGKLWSDDLNEEGCAFTEYYYENNYIDDFNKCAIAEVNDIPLGFEYNWKDYRKFEKVLDNAYEEFKNTNK